MSFKEGFPGEAEFLEHMGDHDEDWLKQPEEAIALGDLPEYWSRNGTLITRGLQDRVTERCIVAYDEMFQRHSPDSLAGEAAQEYYETCKGTEMEADAALRLYDRGEWERLQGQFFEDVMKLWRFDFRSSDNGCQPGMNVGDKGVITPAFQAAVPEFNEWATRRVLEEQGVGPDGPAKEGEAVSVKDEGGHKPMGLGGMDLSRAVKPPVAPQPAVQKETKQTKKSGVKRDGSDINPGYDDSYAIPDEEAEKARGWPDDKY